MERAVTVRPALPEDGQVLFAMNRAFNGEGVASPLEAALALAHPGPRAGAAGLCGRGAGGLPLRAAEALRLLLSALRRGDGAVRLPRLPPPGRGPAAAEDFPDACRQEGVEAVTVLTGEDNAPAQALYQKMGFSPSGEAHFEQGL